LFLLGLAPLGWRVGWWPYRFGLAWLMPTSIVFAAIAVAVSLLALVLRWSELDLRALSMMCVALVLGGAIVAVPSQYLFRGVPAIHDITTDTDNPPQLVATLPLRAGAENTAVYGGPKLAAEQKQGYPDIAPLALPVPPRTAFERAQRAAKEMGWLIIAADPAAGRLEATDTTLWFGFHDDIVVRIVAADGGCRVDVRSVSRVGRSDIGTNAKRIRGFLDLLRA
jgi:uncharacterized protein (DUF1499 family)